MRWKESFRRWQERYRRYERLVPVFSFIGGFLWDSATLTRIDRLSDNMILLLYYLLASGAILLMHLVDAERVKPLIFYRFRPWYPLAIQFFFGGLFSSYVIFYFQSASFTKSAIFLGLLILLLIGNEFLEKRLENVYLQSALHFLVGFSFFIFFLPVISRIMNVWMFLLSAFISLAISMGMWWWLTVRQKALTVPQFRRIRRGVIGLWGIMLIFYFLNWIPPVPLSLKAGGVYHHVHREGERYLLRMERPAWYQFWKEQDDPFRWVPGDTVFCFTAVFAPTRLEKQIVHHWQVYDERRQQWQTTDRRQFVIRGGREAGYRGYTYKRNIRPGKWRVDVETEDGLLLGRIPFRVVVADTTDHREWKILWR
ncbi:MAG: DUF2914 domain-containing protein [Calditrichaeota bacterium]|nr:DUF2914 domain-containing protein [Calditrichota bacterium]